MSISKEKGKYYQEKWEEMEYRFANIEMKKEIERLQEQIEEYQKALDETTSENIDLHSIIKEVREYIKTHWAMNEHEQVYLYELDDRKELLEILDKEREVN